MLAHTKKHPIKANMIFCLSTQGHIYKLPKSITKNLAKYEVQDTKLAGKIKFQIKKTLSTDSNEIFADINAKHGKASALVKAIRFREGMNQTQFAAALHITQGDLSKIESGKRPIGKTIAQRIGKQFDVNPNLLLQI